MEIDATNFYSKIKDKDKWRTLSVDFVNEPSSKGMTEGEGG